MSTPDEVAWAGRERGDAVLLRREQDRRTASLAEGLEDGMSDEDYAAACDAYDALSDEEYDALWERHGCKVARGVA